MSRFCEGKADVETGKRVNNMFDSNPTIVIESYSCEDQPMWVAVAAPVDHPPHNNCCGNVVRNDLQR